MLIVDGAKYKLWIPKDEEEEFHPMVEKYSKQIFGENSLYLSVEKRLISKAGRGVMPDGFAIVFSKTPEMYVVEVELSSHDLDKHIVEQLNRFDRASRNPENRKRIADRLHREIKNDPLKEAFVRQMIGSKEIYKFLSDLVSQQLKTVVIIERKDDMVVEACDALKAPPRILEFKTFVREDAPTVRAHLFDTLYEYRRLPENEGEEERERPPHWSSWKERLKWVNPSVKSLVAQLISKIEKEFPDVIHLPRFRWYFFYKGKSQSRDSIFAVLMITKKEVKVRIRTDPHTFRDEKNWTKSYKGWFFYKQGQEKGFKIAGASQMDYAMKLIKQSYELAK